MVSSRRATLCHLGSYCRGYGAEPGSQDDLRGWLADPHVFLILVRSPEECEPDDRAIPLIDRKSEGRGTTVIQARDGTVYEYPTCWRLPGVLMAAVGGLLTGLISAGLPEISTTQLVVRCRVPPRVAIATSVFTLAVVAAAGAGIHALHAQPVWRVFGWSLVS